jgi:peptide-methionine (R)-S-oxide reductase
MSQSASGFDLTPLDDDQIARLAEDLSPAERHILLNHGTERPGCGVFLDNKKTGTYTCRLCGLPLFRSNSKFESGTAGPAS